MPKNKKILFFILLVNLSIFTLLVQKVYLASFTGDVRAESFIDKVYIKNTNLEHYSDYKYKHDVNNDQISIDLLDNDPLGFEITKRSKEINILPYIDPTPSRSTDFINYISGNYILRNLNAEDTSQLIYEHSSNSLLLKPSDRQFSVNGNVHVKNSSLLTSDISQDTIMKVGTEKPIDLNNYQNDLFLTPGKGLNTNIEFYKDSTENLFDNSESSFESSLWSSSARDCSIDLPGKSEIYIKKNNDASKDKYSLEIGSKNHFACVSKKFAITLNDRSIYKLSFDNKNIKGDEVKYLYKFYDKEGVEFQKPGITETIIARNHNWNRYSSIIDSKNLSVDFENVGFIEIYFYAPSVGREEIVNLYDNVTFTGLELSKSIALDTILNSKNHYQEPEIFLDQGINNISASMDENNLLLDNNPSFESGSWQPRVSDCSAEMPGKPEINLNIANDATDGSKSIRLYSSNHSACISKIFPVSIRNDTIYRLRFDHKSISGNNAKYLIQLKNSQNHTQSYSANINNSSKEWSATDVVLDPKITNINSIKVWLYSVSDGSEYTENLYDNVTLAELAPKDISNYYFQTAQKIEEFNDTQTLSYKKLNNSKIEVTLNGVKNSQILLFTQKFSSKWKIYSNLNNTNVMRGIFSDVFRFKDALPIKQYKVNDQYNGWWIEKDKICESITTCKINDDGSKTISFYIINSRIYNYTIGYVITGSITALMLVYLGLFSKYYTYKRKVNSRRRNRTNDQY